ncbi:phosphomannomutase [Vibrio sp. JCM 19236]|nr:phosphomannomutase [Vibrio sp. JCM 19236]
MSEQISQWLARDPDPKTRDELQHLVDTNNERELIDRFGSRLAFGTAGLRGMIGAGPNRMNRLVIQETAMGLGNYLIEQVADAQSRGIVIGYDGRLIQSNSPVILLRYWLLLASRFTLLTR